jgi:DNA-directed RNA polymerase subunit RPC12/RpoP
MTHEQWEYQRMARRIAAHMILTSDDGGDLTVEFHGGFSIPPQEVTTETEMDVWMVHVWGDVPEGGSILYVGPDDALRRIAAMTEARGDRDVLHYHHGEADQGDFALGVARDLLHADDDVVYVGPDDDDPIHTLTLYPKGAFSRSDEAPFSFPAHLGEKKVTDFHVEYAPDGTLHYAYGRRAQDEDTGADPVGQALRNVAGVFDSLVAINDELGRPSKLDAALGVLDEALQGVADALLRHLEHDDMLAMIARVHGPGAHVTDLRNLDVEREDLLRRNPHLSDAAPLSNEEVSDLRELREKIARRLETQKARETGKAWRCGSCGRFWERDEPAPHAFYLEWRCPECGSKVREIQDENWPGWRGWAGRDGWTIEETEEPDGNITIIVKRKTDK